MGMFIYTGITLENFKEVIENDRLRDVEAGLSDFLDERKELCDDTLLKVLRACVDRCVASNDGSLFNVLVEKRQDLIKNLDTKLDGAILQKFLKLWIDIYKGNNEWIHYIVSSYPNYCSYTLLCAAGNGNTKLIEQLVDSGAQLGNWVYTDTQYTALHCAIRENPQMFRKLLKANPSVEIVQRVLIDLIKNYDRWANAYDYIGYLLDLKLNLDEGTLKTVMEFAVNRLNDLLRLIASRSSKLLGLALWYEDKRAVNWFNDLLRLIASRSPKLLREALLYADSKNQIEVIQKSILPLILDKPNIPNDETLIAVLGFALNRFELEISKELLKIFASKYPNLLGCGLLFAASKNQTEAISKLIVLGAQVGDWKHCPPGYYTALHWAIEKDNQSMFHMLLGADPTRETVQNALIFAIKKYDSLNFVSNYFPSLLKLDWKLNDETLNEVLNFAIDRLESAVSDNLFALFVQNYPRLLEAAFLKAASENKTQVVKKLIALGVHVGNLEPNSNSYTALHWAIEKNNQEMFRVLLRLSSSMQVFEHVLNDTVQKNPAFLTSYLAESIREKPHVLTDEQLGILMRLAIKISELNLTEDCPLIKLFASEYPGHPCLSDALLWAASKNRTELVQELIKAKAPIDQSSAGDTVLHWAFRHQNIQMINSLMDADGYKLLRRKNADDRTPLSINPTAYPYLANISYLEEKGKQSNRYYKVCILEAASANNFEAIKQLVQQNPLKLTKEELATVLTYSDFTDNNALHWAVHHNNFEMVKALLDAGADPHTINYLCKTPPRMADDEGFLFVGQYLRADEQGRNRLFAKFSRMDEPDYKKRIKVLDEALHNSEKSTQKNSRLSLAGRDKMAIQKLAKFYKKQVKRGSFVHYGRLMLLFYLASVYYPEEKLNYLGYIQKLTFNLLPSKKKETLKLLKEFFLSLDDKLLDALQVKKEWMSPMTDLLCVMMQRNYPEQTVNAYIKIMKSVMRDAKGISTLSKHMHKLANKLNVAKESLAEIEINQELRDIKHYLNGLSRPPNMEQKSAAPPRASAPPLPPDELFKYQITLKLYDSFKLSKEQVDFQLQLILLDVEKFADPALKRFTKPVLRMKFTPTPEQYEAVSKMFYEPISSWLCTCKGFIQDNRLEQAMKMILLDMCMSLYTQTMPEATNQARLFTEPRAQAMGDTVAADLTREAKF